MKTYQLVFSPTGGTEKAAAAITKNWPQVRTIDLHCRIRIILQFP